MSTPPDPVAAKSTFLCMYMSNHPDTLVSYVRYWGNVKDGVASAKMTGIDINGMDLAYTTKNGESKSVRVKFEPSLSGYEDVKPRLMTMKADAEEALGMTKAPQIATYHLPPDWWKTAVPILALVYTTFASRAYGPIFALGHVLRESFPRGTMTAIWIFMILCHGLECLYMYSLLRKHQTPTIPATLYILTTLAVGFPSWVDFRRRVQTERIDSIMKGK